MKRGRFVSSIAFLLAAFSLHGDDATPQPAPAEKPSAIDAVSAEVQALFTRSKDAICRIEADDNGRTIAGTGFFIEPNGILITSYGVGGETEEIHILNGDERIPLKRLIADERSGIAILKAEMDKPTPFLRLGKGNRLEIGTIVIAIGYPLEFPISPSLGVVSGFDIGQGGRFFAARHIRSTAPVQPGKGGAPLLNSKGEAVGVIISTLENGNGLFALPGEAVEKVYHDFLRNGRVRQGWLGVDVRLTDAPEQGSAARVRNLRLNGPGFAGGLRHGDVLLQVGEWKITKPEDVLNASFYVQPDEPVDVIVSRASKRLTLKITPAESPDGKGAMPSTGEELFNIKENVGLQLGTQK